MGSGSMIQLGRGEPVRSAYERWIMHGVAVDTTKGPAQELRRNAYLSGPHSKIFIVYFSDRAPTAGFRLSLTGGAIHELPLQHLAPAESHSFYMRGDGSAANQSGPQNCLPQTSGFPYLGPSAILLWISFGTAQPGLGGAHYFTTPLCPVLYNSTSQCKA